MKQVRLAALEEAPTAFGSTHASEATRPEAEWVQRASAGSQGSDRASFFAALNDEVVGLVGGYRDEPFSATGQLVSDVGRGSCPKSRVGAALVDAVTAWAIETDATTISLWVTRGNTPAADRHRGTSSRGGHVKTESRLSGTPRAPSPISSGRGQATPASTDATRTRTAAPESALSAGTLATEHADRTTAHDPAGRAPNGTSGATLSVYGSRREA